MLLTFCNFVNIMIYRHFLLNEKCIVAFTRHKALWLPNPKNQVMLLFIADVGCCSWFSKSCGIIKKRADITAGPPQQYVNYSSIISTNRERRRNP